ncbi:MAG: ribosome recycling factor [Ruminococcaceae bacterium]|nr:ribosome recycling factor [Oscillospiraceae bacterium]
MKATLQDCESKMSKRIAALESELATIRAGRANAAVLDKITVEYFGTPSPINQVAAIAVPEPRMLTISPWDPSILKEIEKAILASDLGINPTNDGKIIRLVFPALTEERRKELVKDVKRYAEECKVSIRNIRRDTIEVYKAMKKKSEITEDDLKNCEKNVQDATDKFCKNVDTVAEKKEKELMSI